MKIRNDWFRMLLVFGMHFSCFILALSVFLMPKEISNHGVIPLRIILMLLFAFVTLALTVYFAEEPVWKTIVKLFGYSTALVTFMIGLYGVRECISRVFGEASELSLAWSIPTAVVGIVSTLLIGKGIGSKWLN
jgi:uncharacterized membrane-anchored protein YitT (DUF2179 family)